MVRTRFDETWHRLREWTKGQTPSERLAAQILYQAGYRELDPSHPLGGKDGGKDALAQRDQKCFAMAVYFPRGEQTEGDIRKKFMADLEGARRNSADGIAFVTNQEITLSGRAELRKLAAPTILDLYHLERITMMLDTPEMAKVREQFLDIEADSLPALNLGGQGGNAPGAGGGGGGVIGNGRGGPGGRGGDIKRSGTRGQYPGAGGGGAGAVGKGAIGGEGGGGGEHIIEALEVGPGTGVHHLEIRVGKGGQGPGEDSIVNACDEEGNVIRSIVAKGGKMGEPPYVPPQSRPPTEDDIEAGLRVTGILAAEFIRFRAGLYTIVEGGWDFWTAKTNPFRARFPLLVEIDTGSIEAGTILDLKFAIKEPDGFQAHEQSQAITVPDSLIRRARLSVVLEFSGSKAGVWAIQILAATHVIGELPIEIRVPDGTAAS